MESISKNTWQIMIRLNYLSRIQQAFKVTPVVALLGPRQCGKTTLAKQYANYMDIDLPEQNYFDLEDVR